MNVSRLELLTALDTVAPGLSARSRFAQSNHFCFSNGRITTYNDEMTCRTKSPLPKEFEAAVEAKTLLGTLRAWTADEIELEATADMLIIKLPGKRMRSRVALQREVVLDTSAVEKPAEWKELPGEFVNAVDIVSTCASPKLSPAALNYVYIHPKYLEATDNLQMARYRVKTGITEPTAVRVKSIKAVCPLGMTRYAETENWLHFRDGEGLVVAVRCIRDSLEPRPVFKIEDGDSIVLPKGLVSATDRASVFTTQIAGGTVLVRLRPGEIVVVGEGITGDHKEPKKVAYEGREKEFLIRPELLAKITEKYAECEIGEGQLLVHADNGKWSYMAALGLPTPKEKK